VVVVPLPFVVPVRSLLVEWRCQERLRRADGSGTKVTKVTKVTKQPLVVITKFLKITKTPTGL